MKQYLDKFYYWYFIVHIPITLLIDSTIVIPDEYQLWIQKLIVSFHIETNKDILLIESPLWFKVFGLFELVVQLPIFVIGSIFLRNRDERITPVMMIYGFNAFFTTLVCLIWVIAEGDNFGLTRAEIYNLVLIYVPYLIIPLVMMIDNLIRNIKVFNKIEITKKNQ